MRYLLPLVAVNALPDTTYLRYLAKYNKAYFTQEEFDFRHSIFRDKLVWIEEFNSSNQMSVAGINKFTDWTDAEYQKLLGYKSRNIKPEPHMLKSSNIESTPIKFYKTLQNDIDWRENDAVAPIVDQGQCGSCWAFSTVASLESAHYRRRNEMLILS